MSRRHNASRRRNYTGRQHEVRERRPETAGPGDWRDGNQFDEVEASDDFSPDMSSRPARNRLYGAHS